MTDTGISELYYTWLCSSVFPEDVHLQYNNALKMLYNAEFTYLLPMDENRKADGIALRYYFSYDSKIPYSLVEREFDQDKCSILEMMVALAMKCEDTIMSDSSLGNRTWLWFRVMFDNLGLSNYPDNTWTESSRATVNYILYAFLRREYRYDGSGGLFKLKNPVVDVRTMQIWDQMAAFTNEINNDTLGI